MAGYTYTTLKQAIQDYTDNDETVFVSQIDNFIKNAEEKVLHLGNLEVFRKNATANMTVSNKYFPKPSDWLSSYTLSIVDGDGNKKFLLSKDVNFIQEYWPDSTETGEPKYYSDFDIGNFIIGPTPDSAYLAELHYFYRPTSIVDSGDGTSWMGTNAGTALLYGSLVEAYTFMKGEPDMIGQYKAEFDQALQSLNRFAMAAEGLDFYKRSNA